MNSLGTYIMGYKKVVLLQGMSGFLQFNETAESVQLVDLFRYGSEFQVSMCYHGAHLQPVF